MSSRSGEREGVIRFHAEHAEEPIPAELSPLAAPLVAWRRVLRAMGWLGRDPERYGGYGYGNLSVRLPEGEGFLVTGSQTSGLEELGLRHFVQVHRWSIEGNRVESRGEILPSSESLSHAALYAVHPEIRVVFHVHAPEVFRRAVLGAKPRLPVTSPRIEAGTPEMAREIESAWEDDPPEGLGGACRGVLVMAGHADGVLAFGESADAAGRSLVRVVVQGARHSGSVSDDSGESASPDRSYR